MDKIPAVEEFKLIHLNKWITVTEKYAWDKLINHVVYNVKATKYILVMY